MDRSEVDLRPHPTLRRYYAEDKDRPGYIRRIFDGSARHYDRISSIMSFGTDRRYRRDALLRQGLAPGMRVLDVACGTGLVSGPARDIVGRSGLVVSLDPSPGMLAEAVRRGRAELPVLGRAECLPVESDRFDLLCMGFALRHVRDLRKTFSEYKRALKPGGKVLILEMTLPESPRSLPLARFYLKTLVPWMAGLSTLNGQASHLMKYFWDTVEQCVPPETILAALEGIGFKQVKRDLRAAVFSEYTAIKP